MSTDLIVRILTIVSPKDDSGPDSCTTMQAPSNLNLKRWYFMALCNLFIAAVIGCLLRAMFIVEIPFIRFKPLLHAHSHVAMLGWMFMAVVVLVLQASGTCSSSRWPHRLLILAQVVVVGMLISFPLEGYGPFSITFSSLHLLISYALLIHLWRATSTWNANGSRALVRMAMIYMIISTAGVWAVPIINAYGLFGTELYYWSIQFFLHFQFNGWLWFAALALWSRWAEQHGAPTPLDRTTVRAWGVSVLLTYALAIAWSERHTVIYAINSAGVLLQLWAGWRTGKAIRHSQQRLQNEVPLWAWRCVTYALIGMGLKVVIQTAVAIPQVATLAFTIRNYVIGFIHLNMLGALSLMLFAMALLQGWWRSTQWGTRLGLSLFTSGVVLTEALLFGQGTAWWLRWGSLPGYYAILLGASVLIPTGVALLLLNSHKELADPTILHRP